ncbi:retrotransposon protein [Hordeum vulgare]|nr:retrotransposon protein [Hordeum vulgare]
MLHVEFNRLKMEDSEALDCYTMKLGAMKAPYASVGATLDEERLVKKPVDTVPDHLYPTVAGMEQFCDVA